MHTELLEVREKELESYYLEPAKAGKPSNEAQQASMPGEVLDGGTKSAREGQHLVEVPEASQQAGHRATFLDEYLLRLVFLEPESLELPCLLKLQLH